MPGDIFEQPQEWEDTEIVLEFHDDTSAIGYASALRQDGFSLGEAIGLTQVAIGLETEVDTMHFINALLRKNTSHP